MSSPVTASDVRDLSRNEVVPEWFRCSVHGDIPADKAEVVMIQHGNGRKAKFRCLMTAFDEPYGPCHYTLRRRL